LRKTLHRDVALDNIMLGKPNAPEGYRGVLMGLDMAILNKRNIEKYISADWKTVSKLRHIYIATLALKSER
jgi:hypothetical protein